QRRPFQSPSIAPFAFTCLKTYGKGLASPGIERMEQPPLSRHCAIGSFGASVLILSPPEFDPRTMYGRAPQTHSASRFLTKRPWREARERFPLSKASRILFRRSFRKLSALLHH